MSAEMGVGGGGADEPGVAQSRWVLHVDMDAFFASCEQLTRPTLIGKPVLVGGIGGRGVVAGCSYESRVFGARSAMPMHQARRLVGVTAVVLPPRLDVYREASRRVFAVLRDRVDVVEQVSIDEAFVEPPELRGATPTECRSWAERFRAAIREETGLPASVGAGVGKQYAKIASDIAKPDGVHVIARRDHSAALDPLPVRSLWGIGPVAGEKLGQIGITTIGELAASDDVEIERVLGRAVGRSILHVARGFDESPVAERAEAKQISTESTFATDLRTFDETAAAVRRAATDAHRRLLKDGRYARTVTVKVKRADFRSFTRSATLPRGTTRLEMILETALGLAPDPVEFGAIRLVGVGLSGLVEEYQGLLFDDDEMVGGVGSAGAGAAGAGAAGAGAAGAGGAGAAGTAPVTAVEHSADSVILEVPDEEVETAESPDLGGNVLPGSRHEPRHEGWRAGDDVRHSEFGHGWVQGSGHGRVSVRFETRATGPGRARTFASSDPALRPADPVDSLSW